MPNRQDWKNPNWLKRVKAWIEACLAQDGLEITGALEQVHLRPWSTVFQVPTNRENFFFKATSPALLHEAVVTFALFTWRPDSIQDIHAVNPDRGWMLMPDGGHKLREFINTEDDYHHWEALLPIFAELQMRLSEKTLELLDLGIPDRRLNVLPAKLEALMEDREAMQMGHAHELSLGELTHLRNFLPELTDLCLQLTDAGVPQSLHHGDLHDGNIFFRNGQYTFFDWGDSCLTHPFFSMRTVFVSLENTLGREGKSFWHNHLMQAYLEPWTKWATHLELVDVFQIARKVSPLCSALSWQRSLSDLTAEDKGPFAAAIPSLLRELLDLNRET